MDEIDTHKKRIVSTDEQAGNIWKCLPIGGNFSYVSIDFNGFGGFVQIIEDPESYDKYKALNLINSLIGGSMMSIHVPVTESKGKDYANSIKPLFEK